MCSGNRQTPSPILDRADFSPAASLLSDVSDAGNRESLALACHLERDRSGGAAVGRRWKQ
jgi:hypothetical protein